MKTKSIHSWERSLNRCKEVFLEEAVVETGSEKSENKHHERLGKAERTGACENRVRRLE